MARNRGYRPPPTPSNSLVVRYLNYGFIELVEQMDRLELQLLDEAEHIVRKSVLDLPGSEIRGTVIDYCGVFLTCSVRNDVSKRTLLIDIMDARTISPQVTTRSDADGFGLVRKIEIQVDTRIQSASDEMSRALVEHYRAAYISLENAFIAAYQRWITDLFFDVYTAVNVDFEIHGLAKLRDRFWFSVTSLANNTFRYHFSVENVKSSISWLKTNQSPVLSPCDAITMLLTTDAPDAVLGVTAFGRPTAFSAITKTISFESLPTLSSDTAFWLAERALFANDGLAASQVATIEGNSFEINYPAEHVGAVDARMTEIGEILEELVARRFREFKQDQKRLRAALKRMSHRDVSAFRELGLDLTAKVIAEMMGPD